MKQLLLAIALIVLLAPCNAKTENTGRVIIGMPGVRSMLLPTRWKQLKGENVWRGHAQFSGPGNSMLTISYEESEKGVKWLQKILSQPPHNLSLAERTGFRENIAVHLTYDKLKIMQVNGQRIIYSDEPEAEQITRCGNDPSPTYHTIQEYYMFKPAGKGVVTFLYTGTSLDRNAWLNTINSIIWN